MLFYQIYVESGSAASCEGQVARIEGRSVSAANYVKIAATEFRWNPTIRSKSMSEIASRGYSRPEVLVSTDWVADGPSSSA